MPIAKNDGCGRLIFPHEFLERRHISPDTEYWLDEREDDLLLHPRLPDVRKLYLEPTTACNLRCRSCIRNAWTEPEALMSMSTFQHLLDGLAALPELQRAVLSGFGEPLLHPRILEMIQMLRERGLTVTLGSNGLLLSPEVARELVKLRLDRLVVSLDGIKPETYAGIRGALLAQVLDNIHALNEAKRRQGSLSPTLEIEFVALRSNVAELSGLATLAAQLGAGRVLVSHVLPYSEEMRGEVLYSHEPRGPLGPSSWPISAGAWILWGSVQLPRMHWGAERRCRFVSDKAIVVGWDGAISPCYALSHNYSYFAVDGKKKQVSRYTLGSAAEQQLASIWQSEEYVRFRSQVRGFHFPSCPDCDLRETCNLRELNQGCWGWNPSCADCLWAQDIVRCP